MLKAKTENADPKSTAHGTVVMPISWRHSSYFDGIGADTRRASVEPMCRASRFHKPRFILASLPRRLPGRIHIAVHYQIR